MAESIASKTSMPPDTKILQIARGDNYGSRYYEVHTNHNKAASGPASTEFCKYTTTITAPAISANRSLYDDLHNA